MPFFNKSNIAYYYQNYLTIDYTEQFDVITLIYCDYAPLSITDRLILLRKVYQVLKPNGKFIFDVFTPLMRKAENRSWYYSEESGFWNKKPHIPFSTFEVQVIDPIYGCEDGETFPIIMTGLQNDKEKIEIIDDPMLEVGQKFLVFTRKNEDGTYKILSGPQGRLEYKDGELNSLQFVNSNVRENNKDMNIKIKNVKAETLTNEIKDNMKENKHKNNK